MECLNRRICYKSQSAIPPATTYNGEENDNPIHQAPLLSLIQSSNSILKPRQHAYMTLVRNNCNWRSATSLSFIWYIGAPIDIILHLICWCVSIQFVYGHHCSVHIFCTSHSSDQHLQSQSLASVFYLIPPLIVFQPAITFRRPVGVIRVSKRVTTLMETITELAIAIWFLDFTNVTKIFPEYSECPNCFPDHLDIIITVPLFYIL